MYSAFVDSISSSLMCSIRDGVWAEIMKPVSWKYGWKMGSVVQPLYAARLHVAKARLLASGLGPATH